MAKQLFLLKLIIIVNIVVTSCRSTDTPILPLPKTTDNQLCCTCCNHRTDNAGCAKTKRDDYYYKQGIGAHKLHTRKASWNEARKICHEEDAHLAIVNSIAEAEQLIYIFNHTADVKNEKYMLIGFHDLYKKDDYVTVHDESLEKAGYDRWGKGQPDNSGGNERCGSLNKYGTLNDITCLNTYVFYCELSQ